MAFKLPLKAFYMIRHGESEANVKNIAAGDFDYPLTSKGINQAKSISMLINKMNLNNIIIYSSPLLRAYQTAEIIKINNNEFNIIKYNDLKERNFGRWEGLPWSKVLAKLDAGIEPPNGETTLEHIQRSGTAFNYILNNSLESNLTPLIVGHGGNFYTFGKLYNQIKIENVDNCQLYYFEPNLQNNNDSELFPWFIWNLRIQMDNDLIIPLSEKRTLYST